ncbi:ATP-binding protein [Aeromicrobium fastidiosum]|uniref:ATP-binding protein n=1 Tax=Aeromicrobium fastidiosum TaxID=52699 RepID=UPI001AE5162F|nr:ATP-binding protein [Aeromicrobium fastidiosum]MBP2390829.1 signal transduction histidine kinase/phage shock protein PspC (stress-responsive transcriptional regulator) [Aeromicrobium fastidiosum]
MTSYRRAYRPAEHRLVGGVATGLAEHLGVPVVYVRVAFVVATWFQGVGVLAYLLLWRLLPLRRPEMSPGLESATRRGLRGGAGGVRGGAREVVQTVALGAVGIGVLLLIQSTGRGIDDGLFAPLLVAIVGVAVVWRQLDDVAWARWMRQTSGWAFASRVAAGAGLIAVAAIYFLTKEGGWGAAVNLASALVIAVLGLGLILGPWIARLSGDLSEERRERVRSQERADVAAHLHDSVLQTLALLQKNAGDAAAVATLARRQERELRDWLYGNDERPGDSLLAALRASAAEVEDAHHVPVEVISVGDTPLDGDMTALARAAREAMVNAAKHAGVDRIDVYAETDGRTATVFVRDRGVGFDPETIADDRMGVRASIVARVERHGGTATIRSRPGEGTEVALSVPIRADTTSTPTASTPTTSTPTASTPTTSTPTEGALP